MKGKDVTRKDFSNDCSKPTGISKTNKTKALKDSNPPKKVVDALDDIDAIFSEAKSAPKKKTKKENPKDKSTNKSNDEPDDDFKNMRGEQKGRKNIDGLPIYSLEELNPSGKRGGDTELCPFDCDCCYI
ncbi:hypothetical protein AKO1_010659 [Acrasis kona]|uniref:DUF1764-domain-containing protein n=1 Tax=Acrasis kona TaxID=1008807 RepID=A0AAW2ZPU7_9EUKA